MLDTVQIATYTLIQFVEALPSTFFMWFVGLAIVLTILANIFHWTIQN